jgi:hypothetical protein
MKSTIFWDVKPCGDVNCRRRFGGTYCLIFKVEEETSFLLGLLFDVENRGSTFFRNVGELIPDFSASRHTKCRPLVINLWSPSFILERSKPVVRRINASVSSASLCNAQAYRNCKPGPVFQHHVMEADWESGGKAPCILGMNVTYEYNSFRSRLFDCEPPERPSCIFLVNPLNPDWLLNCFWVLPAQWFLVPSPTGLTTIYYFLMALGAFRTFSSKPTETRRLWRLYKYSVRTSQETLRLHSNDQPVNAVYCENHKEHINTLCGQNVCLLVLTQVARLVILESLLQLEEQLHNVLPRVPVPLQEAAVRLLSRDSRQRPTAQLLSLIKYFR